jgi:hypothetical protein
MVQVSTNQTVQSGPSGHSLTRQGPAACGSTDADCDEIGRPVRAGAGAVSR